MVLVWDLMNQSNGGAGAGGAAPGDGSKDNHRGPTASWRCDYEVGNLSWAPNSALNKDGKSEWLGVSGGRGIWGVKLGS
jgi:WD repeat-containing protein 68